MHPEAYKLVEGFVGRAATERCGSILDVGSLDLNGSLRPLTPTGWTYTGLDIVPGKNVDLVVRERDWYQDLGGEQFDLVISSSCLEHVRHPWIWICDVFAAVKPDGRCYIVAPHEWPEHRHPLDCWRILPDGMRVLLGYAGFEKLEVGAKGRDTFGEGTKEAN